MDSAILKEAIKHFLAEDIGAGDVTSESIFSPGQVGSAIFVAKGAFIAAGMEQVAAEVFRVQSPAIICSDAALDGEAVSEGDILLKLRGPVLDLLKAERVALNLVQRLCGIATMTSQFVVQVKHFQTRIVDTRKTTPGLRMLEKYAVRAGGGHNHRFNLADGVLIKDNHISASGSVKKAVDKVRRRVPHTMKIEVEAETISQVEECLACNVDIIMLDNMSIDMMHQAVDLVSGKALTEASGGVNLNNVSKIAETGVDLISVGALTHSAPACDISMKMYDV